MGLRRVVSSVAFVAAAGRSSTLRVILFLEMTTSAEVVKLKFDQCVDGRVSLVTIKAEALTG